jgi:hypothetical protein
MLDQTKEELGQAVTFGIKLTSKEIAAPGNIVLIPEFPSQE